MKMLDCLPYNIAGVVAGLNGVREIRIRDMRAARINVSGKWYYISDNSLSLNSSGAVIAEDNACDEIVKKACNNSVYAYEKSISGGYFSLEDGVRVGVCGHVFGTGKNVFQKYTSLCFRVPQYINCVSNELLEMCRKHRNIILIGPPCSGKTTFLRDLAIKLSKNSNVLVADERGEIFFDDKLLRASDCDVFKWAEKSYVFETGIRAMSPDWVVFDELSRSDVPYVENCCASGVNVVCSAHGLDLNDVKLKYGNFISLFEMAIVFSRNDCSFQIELL